MLDIYAGENALKTIKQQGFKADLFTTFLGASGGPKCFVLTGLDKYLFGDFFANRTKPLNVVGSSIGAFRTACICQQDPIAAIERFIDAYFSVIYKSRPTSQEATDSIIPILNAIFGEDKKGIHDIINNKVFKAHFIVAKANGLVGKEHKYLILAGLLKSFVLNAIGRTNLNRQYERFTFQQVSSDLDIIDPYGFVTTLVPLTEQNTQDALLASACIPLLMAGIKDISGADKGMYRDGGIIDYHFDIKINNPGLTLYPHFNSIIKPGWFDKSLNRAFSTKNYDDTIVLCPSSRFIQSLPYNKISDRTDFEKMTDKNRIAYWNIIIERSEELASEMADFVQKQDLSIIKSVSQLNK